MNDKLQYSDVRQAQMSKLWTAFCSQHTPLAVRSLGSVFRVASLS